MARKKDTEFGVDSGQLVPRVVREDREAMSFLPARQMQEIYALDNLRDDEDPAEVGLPRGTEGDDPRQAPFKS